MMLWYTIQSNLLDIFLQFVLSDFSVRLQNGNGEKENFLNVLKLFN